MIEPIPRLPFLIRLPYSKYNGADNTVVIGQDPKLSEDELVEWLSHVPDEFWTYIRYTDCFEIPALHNLPLRYRTNSDFVYHSEMGENDPCGSVFNPFTFYGYCKNIRWSPNYRFLYSSTTGWQLCFDRPYSTFRRCWESMDNNGATWPSPKELLRAVEEHTNRSYIDGEIFAYHLFNDESIPWPHEFGALDNSWI
ncbi:hypothetical protein PM082_021670 [Marasmius tenuissimus]|nr:hypothetical protein PM082_021670 [Marasmius tenuissimus]